MLSKLSTRLRALLRKSEMEHELDEELRHHIEQQTEQNIRLGMNPEEARYAARKAFGGVEQAKERSRDARGVRWLEELWQDLRYGARMLLKNPGFTLVAVITLALGIGANTAIFSVINRVLLRPLPYREPERLTILSQKTPQGQQVGFSIPDLFDFKEQNQSFTQCGGFYWEPINFGSERGTEQLLASYVTVDFFAALGEGPSRGRGFLPADDYPGASQIAIISNRLWQERLGGDPGVVGSKVTLDGRLFEVIGVMPAGFHFYERIDLWLPIGLWPYSRERDNRWALFAVARLKPSVTIEAARAEMDAIAGRLSRQYPQSNANRGAALSPLYDETVGAVRPSLRLLLAAVGFVLLIACLNVANLLLARGAARNKEMAIRSALGAGRWRIARQLFTESLLLAILGGALGSLLAIWLIDLTIALGGADIPRLAEVGARSIDHRVLGFSILISLLAGLIAGLMPALRSAQPDLTAALKDGAHTLGGARGQRLRHALVVGEVALAIVLLIGAGLLIRSLMMLRGVNPGYNPKQTLTVVVSLPRANYRDDYDRARFAQRAMESLNALPGAQQAASSYPLPIYGMAWGMSYRVEGEASPSPGEALSCQTASISPGFFSTLHVPLLRGRDFSYADTSEASRTIIIDETLARRHWPDESPIGNRLTVTGDRPRTVVGVVGSVRNWGLSQEPRAQIYIPHAQPLDTTSFVPYVYISLRTQVRPESLAAAVRGKIEEVDRDVAMSEIRTMDELLDQSVVQQRFAVFLMEIFAGLALVLAAIGVYGVMSYAVAQQTREIGIRMALGAERRDVLKLFLGQGLSLTLVGVAIGLAAAFGLTRLMKTLLFGVSATDPLTFALIAVLLTAVALLAVIVPARRATKVDPLAAFRSE
ncbi:MAG: ADOP family duplicated permease [Blastocatellia bacterium]